MFSAGTNHVVIVVATKCVLSWHAESSALVIGSICVATFPELPLVCILSQRGRAWETTLSDLFALGPCSHTNGISVSKKQHSLSE